MCVPRVRVIVRRSLVPTLDPLSATDHAAVCTAVLTSPSVPARLLHFHYVGLDEPDKKYVLSYAHGTSTTILPRRALVIARAGGESHELVIDVTDASAPSVVSHAVHHGPGFPMITSAEETAAMALSSRYPQF